MRCYASERRHLQIVFGGVFECGHDVLGSCSGGLRRMGLSEALPVMYRIPSQRMWKSDVCPDVPGFVHLETHVSISEQRVMRKYVLWCLRALSFRNTVQIGQRLHCGCS